LDINKKIIRMSSYVGFKDSLPTSNITSVTKSGSLNSFTETKDFKEMLEVSFGANIKDNKKDVDSEQKFPKKPKIAYSKQKGSIDTQDQETKDLDTKEINQSSDNLFILDLESNVESFPAEFSQLTPSIEQQEFLGEFEDKFLPGDKTIDPLATNQKTDTIKQKLIAETTYESEVAPDENKIALDLSISYDSYQITNHESDDIKPPKDIEFSLEEENSDVIDNTSTKEDQLNIVIQTNFDNKEIKDTSEFETIQTDAEISEISIEIENSTQLKKPTLSPKSYISELEEEYMSAMPANSFDSIKKSDKKLVDSNNSQEDRELISAIKSDASGFKQLDIETKIDLNKFQKNLKSPSMDDLLDFKEDLTQDTKQESVTDKLSVFDIASKNVKFTKIEAEFPVEKATPKPSEQVALKVQENLRSNSSKMSITLVPEKLGRVDIDLSIVNGKINKLSVTASKHETLELLIRDSVLIEDAVKEIIKSEINMSFNFKDDNSHGEGNQKSPLSEAQKLTDEHKDSYIGLKSFDNTGHVNIISETKVDVRL
jgi:hypothetical protein